MASYQAPCFPVIYIDALSTKKVAAFEFFSLAGVVDPFRGAGPFLLCLAKYRADCPMNEICCDSDIFTIYQNETGFVKRSNLYASTQTFPRKCSITTRISKVA
jgi:hypothetical protein